MVWYRIENIWQCCLGRYLIVSTFCSICALYSVVTTFLFCKTIIVQKEATLKHLAIKNCEKTFLKNILKSLKTDYVSTFSAVIIK